MPNKILTRIKNVSKDLKVNHVELFQKVIPSITDDVTTTEIDEIIAFKAADMIISHPDYSVLGGRILMTRQGKLLNIDLEPIDYDYDFFAATTFLEKYSIKDDNKVPLELPSMMYDRIAYELYKDDEDSRKELYHELVSKKGSFATPILTNTGVENRGSLISCNKTMIKADSLDGIEDTKRKIAEASKAGAGIGGLLDPIRSKHSMVSSFKNNAGGIMKLMKMIEPMMEFYKQGDRSGSFSPYLSIWHRDIEDFISSTLPTGEESQRVRKLFTGVIINDLFMKTLISNGTWYLFCPNDIKKAGLKPLYDLLGDDFEREYNNAVNLGLGTPINAQALWAKLIKSQVESGRPYTMFKENMNWRWMQDNIGIAKFANLCTEFIGVSLPEYTSQCTLASINLPAHNTMESIWNTTRIFTKALNRVIDINKWSDNWSEKAGLDQRALAIGVAGMADYFAINKISFESDEAKFANKEIFETMYKASVTESNRLAEIDGCYPAWNGSRYEEGDTYIEGWSPIENGEPIKMRNSLLLGLMPTATTAGLLGSFESFEPVNSNIFNRTVGQGNFLRINKYLVRELEELNLWTPDIRNLIVINDGSVQNIENIPSDIQYRYKTVWEIPQRTLLDLAIIRNKYVDQSQSMNVYHVEPKLGKISSALVHAWKGGLKTGSYYTRVRSKLDNNKKLSVNTDPLPQKPKNSVIECFGCQS